MPKSGFFLKNDGHEKSPQYTIEMKMMVMRSHRNAELMTSHDHHFRDYREKDGHVKSSNCQTHDFT